MTVYLPVIPPKRGPKVHHPFPKIKDPGTLIMSLTRFRAKGSDYRIQIHGDGTVVYDGYCQITIDGHCPFPDEVLGHRTSHISEEVVNSLFNQFKEVDFFSLARGYEVLTLCVTERKELSIAFDGHRKRVTDELATEAGMPDAVMLLERAVDSVTNSSQWIAGNATHGCG